VYGTRIERARSHTDYKARKIDYKQVASKHDYEAIAEKCRTPIYQLDLNGNVINRFCSIKDAATALKVSAGHICDCLRGKRGKTGGFKWAYAN